MTAMNQLQQLTFNGHAGVDTVLQPAVSAVACRVLHVTRDVWHHTSVRRPTYATPVKKCLQTIPNVTQIRYVSTFLTVHVNVSAYTFACTTVK